MRIEKIMSIFLKGFVPIVAQLDVEERESWVEQNTQEKMPEKIHTYSTIQLWAAPTVAAPPHSGPTERQQKMARNSNRG